MILCLAYVVDEGLKALLVVDIECASTLSPPFLANRRGRGIMFGEWTETFLLQRLEPAVAPGFELLPDLLGFASPATCNPACSGLSNLTYLPTRQRGFRGTPLARASGYMQQHAELPCRGNTPTCRTGSPRLMANSFGSTSGLASNGEKSTTARCSGSSLDDYEEFVEKAKPDWKPIPQDYIPLPSMTPQKRRACSTGRCG